MRVERTHLSWMALIVSVLIGCSGGTDRVVPTTVVQPSEFTVTIRAHGELEAAESTVVETSRNLRGRQRIAWIADDGLAVREGDLVVRLDADDMRRRLQGLQSGVRKLEFQIESKREDVEKERAELASRRTLLEQQREDAIAMKPRDETLFSRQQIIEAQVDLDLIETKLAHLTREQTRSGEKGVAELEILRLQQSQRQSQIDEIITGLDELDVYAPHGGVFLRGKTWQGEKMRVGLTVWTGMRLGELPDTAELQAKVFVLESEAAGLTEGLRATVSLDGAPDVSVDAEVKGIQPVANPIVPESPVKYFEVVLSLASTDPTVMQPAGQVRAEIEVERRADTLSVPNQAIFSKDGKSWIHVKNGSGFERREIETGMRSVSRTVIESGIEPGDRIALVDPLIDEG